jgi:hypothetical protein
MVLNFSITSYGATGDKTWVSFVNVETKEQSKQWMHTHSPNKPKEFKQSFSARELMATLFWDRNGANGRIHATNSHNNVRSVLRNTKNSVGPFRKKKGVEC